MVHRDLKRRLREASGQSSFVVAVNVDIRGFSSFFSDSSQAAAYLSSPYTRILDDYFPSVSFFKPTGDGLLLVRDITRAELGPVVAETVHNAVRLEDAFADICRGDDLINFGIPQHVGIGIARGTATRISSGRFVLDYSGYPLNLASRLMDLARPRGVIFDASLGLNLLEGAAAQRFSADQAYVKGLADRAPITIYRTGTVEIPEANRRPFGAELFVEAPEALTLKDIRERAPKFLHDLKHKPFPAHSLQFQVEYPSIDARGRRRQGYVTMREFSCEFEEGQGLPYCAVDYHAIQLYLEQRGVKRDWPIKVQISYSVPVGTAASAETS